MKPSQRPWRALVRVKDIKRDGLRPNFRVVVPSWNPRRVIVLPLSILPESIAKTIQPGARLHAQVNIGAEEEADLFFLDWEPK